MFNQQNEGVSTVCRCIFAASASGVASIVDAAGDGSAIVPPYEESFLDESFMDDYTIIDVNGDGTKWKLDSYLGKVEISYNSSEAMNDWLITPAMALEGGKNSRRAIICCHIFSSTIFVLRMTRAVELKL